MKIISKKTQWRLIMFIVARSENILLSDFKGTEEEQINKFEKYVREVVDLVYKLGGVNGLAFLESRYGISSNPNFKED